ncbi:hypothetical protein H4219_003314 [Mycoemilia scoparia]|uniref:Major facilitator superfamily (MFS) profile domain-containing protein n=1 Tax=Mycoemilia scoparia TaxID=417184 RepID=A0A9W8DT50_9FUNG|nr:hypothetical protein H4219_003314 [Mycoemilia scoparia]
MERNTNPLKVSNGGGTSSLMIPPSHYGTSMDFDARTFQGSQPSLHKNYSDHDIKSQNKQFTYSDGGRSDYNGPATSDLDYVVHKVGKKQFIAILVTLMLALLLSALDQTIVATAIPKISNEFNSLSNASWIATAYMLTSTALQPLYGKLSDIFGRLATLLFSLIIFLIGSILCATAKSMTWLIAARAVTGVGGAGALALAIIVLSEITSIRNRPKAFALISIVWGIACIAGPLLGGVFTDKVSWRWCFYINLPVGGVTVITAILFMRLPTPKGSLIEKIKRVDFLGVFLLVGALVMVLLGLSWGGKEYSWSSVRVLCLLIIGVALLGVFVVIELKIPKEPIIAPSLFKYHNASLALIISLLFGWPMLTLVYYLPLYFSIVHNASAIMSGVKMLPLLVTACVGSVITGVTVTRLGFTRVHMCIGAILGCIGSGCLFLLDENSGNGKQIGLLFIPGITIGIIMPTNSVIGQAAVPTKLMPVVTALIMFMRSMGGVIGLSLSNTILTNTLKNNLGPVIAKFPQYAKIAKKAINDSNAIWTSGLPKNVQNEIVKAYADSLAIVFVVLVPLYGLVLIGSCLLKATDLKGDKRNENPEATSSNQTLTA